MIPIFYDPLIDNLPTNQATKDLTNLTFNPPFIVGIPRSKSNPVWRINWTLSQTRVTCQPGHLARITLPNWAYKFRKSFV